MSPRMEKNIISFNSFNINVFATFEDQGEWGQRKGSYKTYSKLASFYKIQHFYVMLILEK